MVDDCYVIDHQPEPAGRLVAAHGQLIFNTDRNGMVIFTANPDHGQATPTGKYHALAVELQTLPDAINHHGFGDPILRADTPRTLINQYRYVGNQTR